MVSSTLALTGVLLAWAFYKLMNSGKRQKGLPPGPPTVPVLGNALVLPPRYAHLYFQDQARKLNSDICSFKVFDGTLIVLNSATATHDLFDKRSASFDGRPPNWLTADYICRGQHILLARKKENQVLRKLWNKMLGNNVISNYVELQEAESCAVLQNIVQSPSGFYEEMKRYSCSLTLAIAHGKRAPTYAEHDQSGFSVKDFYRISHEFTAFLEVGGAPPIDFFPFLKHTPEVLAQWKTQAKKSRRDLKRFYEKILFKETVAKVKSGQFDADSCWMADLIINNKEGLSDEALAWQGGVIMEGGADTTQGSLLETQAHNLTFVAGRSGALLTAILAACAYPDAVKKAHEELDRVCGSRMPRLGDIDQLPYCKAFIREVLRWRPVTPASVPHLATKEEQYKGFLIPVNSVVVQNNWAIFHDPESFDEPEMFRPERYVQNEFGLKAGVNESVWRNTFTFGAGRRICQGAALAENSLAITVPKLLWAFDFAAPGKVNVDAFIAGHITAPEPFDCMITPRSDKHRDAIRQEYEACQSLYERYAPGKAK